MNTCESKPNRAAPMCMIVFIMLSCCIAARPAHAAQLTVHARSREKLAPDADAYKVVCKRLDWDPAKTAIIICDMWNEHWCKGATSRVGELAPRINDIAGIARDQGSLIIHAPSGTIKHYADHAARRHAADAPKAANVPDGIAKWCTWKNEIEKQIGYPIDHSDGGCDCQPTCKQGPPWPWKSQIDTIQIHNEDAISDSGVEIWNLLEDRGIENVILMGVHTNMCVLGRPFGLRNMARFGKNVVLMRDLTDTMYNSRKSPYVSHFTGTDLVVEHIEKHVCPTIASTDFTGRPPFRFANDRRPRAVIISAESEYGAVQSMPDFAEELQLHYGVHCDVLQGSPEQNSTDRHEISGMEALEDTDLVVVFARRRAFPASQMKYLRDYLKRGKPLIGLRTASHAFDSRGSAPPGHDEWPKFDADVLGGNYHGHHGRGPKTTVTLAAGAHDHPILAGVKLPFTSNGSLYEVRPLAKTATPLLIGTIPDKDPEPLAWTSAYGSSRVFYTSLGHVDDFKNPQFRRLLINAAFWAMNKPVPQANRPVDQD